MATYVMSSTQSWLGPSIANFSGSIGINRLIMIAVGRREVTASSAWLKIVLAHQPPDLLVIDDHASIPQLFSASCRAAAGPIRCKCDGSSSSWIRPRF